MRSLGGLALLPALAGQAAVKGEKFDFAVLKGRARHWAGAPYQPWQRKLPAGLDTIDWDHYQALRFHAKDALWAGLPSNFRVSFFHLGLFYKRPVRMNEVVKGRAYPILYHPEWFDWPGSGINPSKLPDDLGYAGFRLNFHSDWVRDVVAFLGASYFRAVSSDMQYGLSARGIAIDCGLSKAEEFPDFVEFWLERPAPSANTMTLYALLDGPSLAGAYRFMITVGGGVVMDIDCALYPRKTVERLGVAPLTSMFLRGENARRVDNDWRPNIHDSDGLSMYAGNGEWLWWPLTNPAHLRFNAFLDHKPRGFGLLQRDRNFDHYQDDGVFYEQRPSLWVEPRFGFTEGAINLISLPAEDETTDNIVAFWNPTEPLKPNEERLFSYRLYWRRDAPQRSPLARVVATRMGIGGIVGQPKKYFSQRYVIDFAGENLEKLANDAAVEAVITASEGRVELVSARPLAAIHGRRAMFDLVPPDTLTRPIDLRVFLRRGTEALSETWLSQWLPEGS